jgi:hypothetical protein
MAGRNWERNQANDTRDHFDREIKVGQTVCKPSLSGRSAIPEIRVVEEVVDGKVYLSGNAKRVPLNYSGRIVILAEPGEEFPPK